MRGWKISLRKASREKTKHAKNSYGRKCSLERNPLIEIEADNFSEADSTSLVRERMRQTKLEGAFKKVKGAVVGQSEHTISILPKTGKREESDILEKRRGMAKQGGRSTPMQQQKQLAKSKEIGKIQKKGKRQQKSRSGKSFQMNADSE